MGHYDDFYEEEERKNNAYKKSIIDAGDYVKVDRDIADLFNHTYKHVHYLGDLYVDRVAYEKRKNALRKLINE